MPYPRYAIHLKRAASCGACGRDVRVRGYIAAMLVGLIIAGAVIAFVAFYELDFVGMLIVIAAIALIAVAVDYSFWRWVGFEAVPEEDVPAADAREAQRETLSSP
ncbi:MAG TPA: hypothetical protein VMN78_09200 [Longimicrobiales bacterium]|nr:hypothetical protein [Longimicrobiales bacterium]